VKAEGGHQNEIPQHNEHLTTLHNLRIYGDHPYRHFFEAFFKESAIAKLNSDNILNPIDLQGKYYLEIQFTLVNVSTSEVKARCTAKYLLNKAWNQFNLKS
jgi:hypothetical protein